MARTVVEIKAALDLLGISYPSDAKKIELEALLTDAEDTSDTLPEEPEEVEEPTNIVDDTPPQTADKYVICPACSGVNSINDMQKAYVAPDGTIS